MTTGRLLRHFGLVLGGAMAGLLVAAALVVSVGRYYLESIDEHRQFLLAELEQRTGLRVVVDSLSGDWRRLTPQLRATGLAILHPVTGEPVLQADRMVLRVDLLRSLAAAAPRLQLVTVDGVQIELEEIALGRWRLHGFGGESGGDATAAFDLVLGMDRVRLQQVQLQLRFVTGHASSVFADQISLSRAGGFRRLRAGLQLSAGQPAIDLVVESYGDPRGGDPFRARGHASFIGVDLSPVLPLLEPLGIELREGLVDGELWLEWLGERTFSAQGQLSIPVLDLAGLSGRRLEPLTDVALRLRLHAGSDDWRLWLPSLQARWSGHALQLDRLLLQRRANGAVELALPRLALAPLAAALSESGLLDADQQSILTGLAPRGELARLRVELPVDGAPRLRAEMENVAVAPWHNVPGASGVDGYIEMEPRRGTAVLASRDLQLEFPEIYSQPLHIDRLDTTLRWAIDQDQDQDQDQGRVRVHSGPITASAELGAVAGHLSLDLPLQHDAIQPPEMTLVLGVRNSRSRYRDQLLPDMLSPDLLAWLGRAIGPAELPVGGFIYRGSLRHDDAASRTVQLLLEVRDGELDYYPPWPALRGINGQVLVDDGETWVSAAVAQTLSQSRITDAHFHFDPATQRLRGRGVLESVDADLMQWFTATPLRDTVGAVMDDWTWQGPATADIVLDLPLGDDAPADVAITAELGPGRLELGNLGLTVTELQGPFEYRTDPVAIGLRSDGLRGRLFGEPVQARLGPSKAALQLALDIPRLSIAELQDWLQLPVPLERIASGYSAVDALIEMDGDGVRLRAQSDLQGVTIALPEPWRKAADKRMPLQLSMAPLKGPLQLTVGDDFQLVWQTGDTMAGSVALGRAAVAEPVPGRIRVTGALDTIDLAEWSAVLDALRPAAKPELPDPAVTAMVTDPVTQVDVDTAAADRTADTAMPVDIAGLEIARLSLLGRPVSGVRISGEGDGNGSWRLQLQADQLSGDVVLPAPSGAPLAIWLGRLDLTSGGDAPAVPSALDLDLLDQVPELEFAVGALRIDGELLGGIRFDLQRLEDGLRLDRLGGNLHGVSITGGPDRLGGRLDWREDADGTYSEFQGRLLAGDMTTVLAGFGYEPALASERAVLDSWLHWRGGPDLLSLTSISGEASLLIEQGRFSKVSDSTSGALKALGIFNLANLTRRLRLDFSDIFRSGVSFNRLEGKFKLDHGLVETLRPLRVDSPSSRFVANGQVDFNTDQVRMELVATLPIASSLPWVAALAGGLPAAAGVYIVGKLFEEQMDRYSSVMYRIDGSWTDPRVEFVRVFDDRSMTGEAASSAPSDRTEPAGSD